MKNKNGKTFTLPITFTVTSHEGGGGGTFMILEVWRRLLKNNEPVVEIGVSPACDLEISGKTSPWFHAQIKAEDLLTQIYEALPEIRKQVGLRKTK